ncbi:toll/interleukin-1 receptor domain-containing protein [Variovorax sp. J22P240]|uniref:toll/interleukin-1 receptor domain-containing protein n=1 Tax=Variovorax sp. J22P240 TaxID=3053514 RepID=UPI0025778829|nr:toll/interleukin-1 receptor domain-containing protein [Variovorax sp. J22P240]MDM0002836.1 toll/interleukin-1 receptor domain-containing protein [Variovorax sp. J22P240]
MHNARVRPTDFEVEPLARDLVFISYRRTDSIAPVTALRQTLVRRFGVAAVFHDLSSIPPGAPFPDYLRAQLQRAVVVIAVIGNRWLTASDGDSRRRIDDPRDWVHIELAAALSDDQTTVIPLLVEGAPWPPADALPPTLQSLVILQAVPVSYEAWDLGLEPLLNRIGELLGTGQNTGPTYTRFRPSYRPILRALRVAHPTLLDRDDDLASLVLAAQHDGYLVVEGDAWTGKTALVVHLTAELQVRGMDVIAYFVEENRENLAKSFYTYVNSQLLDLIRGAGGLAEDHQLGLQFQELWVAASSAAGSSGRRLVLCVDAIDEQSQDDPIAACLPVSLAAGVTVIVTSRPFPSVDSGLPAYHPLATLDPTRRYRLTGSPHARAYQAEAQRAIAAYLDGPDANREDLIGFLAASRAPLATDELSELLEIAPGRVESLIRPIGRYIRHVEDVGGSARVQLNHTELVRQARAWFGRRRVGAYVARLLGWADHYAKLGWPTETSWYLVAHLDDLVQRADDVDDRLGRLERLLADARIALLRRRFHFQPLFSSINFLRSAPAKSVGRPDELRLAVLSHELRAATEEVPIEVLVGLAAVGEVDFAIQRTLSNPDGVRASEALIATVDILADRDFPAAVDIANRIPDERLRRQAFVLLASRKAVTDPEAGLAIAMSIDDVAWKAVAVADVAAATSQEELAARAVDLAGSLDDVDERREALIVVAKTFAPAAPRLALQTLIAAGIDSGMADTVSDAIVRLAKIDVDEALSAFEELPPDGIEFVRANLALSIVGIRPSAAIKLGHDLDRSETLLAGEIDVALLHSELAGKLAEADLGLAHQYVSELKCELARTCSELTLLALSGDLVRIGRLVHDLNEMESPFENRYFGIRQELIYDLPPLRVEAQMSFSRNDGGRLGVGRVIAACARSIASSTTPASAISFVESLADPVQRGCGLSAVAALERDPALARAAFATIPAIESDFRTDVAEWMALECGSAGLIVEAWDALGRFDAGSGPVGRFVQFVSERDASTAVDLVRSIGDASIRSKLLATLGVKLLRRDLVEEADEVTIGLKAASWTQPVRRDLFLAVAARDPQLALQLADSLDNPFDRDKVLLAAASTAASSDRDVAATALGHVQDAAERAIGLAHVAAIWNHHQLAADAIDLARARPPASQGPSLLFDVGSRILASDLGLIDHLKDAIAGTPDARDLFFAAGVDLVTSKPDDMLALGRLVKPESHRAVALASLANVLHRPELRDEAIETARRQSSGFDRAVALGRVGKELGQPELEEQALVIARSLEADEFRAAMIYLIKLTATRSAANGEEQARSAFSTAATIDDPDASSMVDQALAVIAQETAGREPGTAIRLAEGIGGEELRVNTTLSVAAEIGRTDVRAALGLLDQLGRRNYDTEQVIAGLVGNLATTDPDAATELATAIANVQLRDDALVSVAGVLEATNLQAAHEMTEMIDDGNRRVEFALHLVAQLAETDPRVALEWTEQIGDTPGRARALLDLSLRWAGSENEELAHAGSAALDWLIDRWCADLDPSVAVRLCRTG